MRLYCIQHRSTQDTPCQKVKGNKAHRYHWLVAWGIWSSAPHVLGEEAVRGVWEARVAVRDASPMTGLLVDGGSLGCRRYI